MEPTVVAVSIFFLIAAFVACLLGGKFRSNGNTAKSKRETLDPIGSGAPPGNPTPSEARGERTEK